MHEGGPLPKSMHSLDPKDPFLPLFILSGYEGDLVAHI